jgi:putative transcriptional regulator
MYHYADCGLDYVYLKNGYVEMETAYGPASGITDVEGLHQAIALHLVKYKPRFSGAEAQFLRKHLDLSQSHLGQLIGVDESSVRAWEKHRERITKPAERLMRALVVGKVHSVEISELLEQISHLNRDAYQNRLELEETASGWVVAG